MCPVAAWFHDHIATSRATLWPSEHSNEQALKLTQAKKIKKDAKKREVTSGKDWASTPRNCCCYYDYYHIIIFILYYFYD